MVLGQFWQRRCLERCLDGRYKYHFNGLPGKRTRFIMDWMDSRKIEYTMDAGKGHEFDYRSAYNEIMDEKFKVRYGINTKDLWFVDYYLDYIPTQQGDTVADRRRPTSIPG